MLKSDQVFAGAVPDSYDRLMVPLIFAPFAADLAGRAASFTPTAVLEIAAGTGVVTRALAPRLSAEATYVVTDLNQPMLDYAAARQGADARITWAQADAVALPFEDARFDVVCCQFGAMCFPDRRRAYREARRVLRPGGRFLMSVWDRIEHNDFADDVTQALAGFFPHDPPRFLVRTPHGYHDTALIHGDLEAAGFSHVVIETKAEESRTPAPRIPALAYCQGTLLRNEIEARAPGQLESVTERVTSAIAQGMVAGKSRARFRPMSSRQWLKASHHGI